MNACMSECNLMYLYLHPSTWWNFPSPISKQSVMFRQFSVEQFSIHLKALVRKILEYLQWEKKSSIINLWLSNKIFMFYELLWVLLKLFIFENFNLLLVKDYVWAYNNLGTTHHHWGWKVCKINKKKLIIFLLKSFYEFSLKFHMQSYIISNFFIS